MFCFVSYDCKWKNFSPAQETEGPGGGGEGAEEGRAAEKARAEAAGAGGEEEPEEAAAAAGGGAEEAADEDRHGGEEAAAGSAQPGIHPAHRRAAGQGQGRVPLPFAGASIEHCDGRQS